MRRLASVGETKLSFSSAQIQGSQLAPLGEGEENSHKGIVVEEVSPSLLGAQHGDWTGACPVGATPTWRAGMSQGAEARGLGCVSRGRSVSFSTHIPPKTWWFPFCFPLKPTSRRGCQMLEYEQAGPKQAKMATHVFWLKRYEGFMPEVQLLDHVHFPLR